MVKGLEIIFCVIIPLERNMAKTKIHIGTSGWSYPKGEGTWEGYFYPAGIKDELEYYSRFFNVVEINTSFYRPPDPHTAQSWAQRTPDGFLFAAKLWQKFTHPKMFKAATGEEAVISQDDVDIFCRGIEPIAMQGKLGVLLAQFPPSFINDDYGKQIIQAIIKSFHQYPLAVELRHKSWSDEPGTAKLLKENNVAWAQIDEPKFSISVASEVPMTADVAYFRYHGRNRENWWTGNGETRYQYLYSPEEVAGLAEKLKEAASQTIRLFAFFNNHFKAYAPRNAVDLEKTLQLPHLELPVKAKE